MLLGTKVRDFGPLKKEEKGEKTQKKTRKKKKIVVEPTDKHHARTRKVMQSGWAFWGRAGGRLWDSVWVEGREPKYL